MPVVCEEKRQRVITSWKSGLPLRTIARQLSISLGAVQKIINKFKKFSTVKNISKTGPLPKTSSRERRQLILMAKYHPKWSATRLKQEWQVSNPVSARTVRRILSNYGLMGRVAAKKPKLNRKQKMQRLKWCRSYGIWDRTMWRNVIFSDESPIPLRPTVRVYVRRPVNQRFSKRYIIKTMKYGGGSIMVWGAINAEGKGLLFKFDGNVNSLTYQAALTRALPLLLAPNAIFQQDGAPAHKSKSTQNFFSRRGIIAMDDWPAQSPDLNIIEQVWPLLKGKVALHKARTKNELWQVTLEEWNKIPTEFISRLYDSISHRITEVIHKHGGHTKY
jgi:transposase